MIYKILNIKEADYGCEECHKDGPHALLILEGGKEIEVSEKWIQENGIQEGKRICIKEDGKVQKAVRVVAAVIKAEQKDPKTGENVLKIFATQRGYGELKDGWEFPGGKIEENETPEEALKREIREELDAEIAVGDLITTVEYDYPSFHLSMDCFWAQLISDKLILKEHEAAKWLGKEELDSVDWLPADRGLVELLKRILK